LGRGSSSCEQDGPLVEGERDQLDGVGEGAVEPVGSVVGAERADYSARLSTALSGTGGPASIICRA